MVRGHAPPSRFRDEETSYGALSDLHSWRLAFGRSVLPVTDVLHATDPITVFDDAPSEPIRHRAPIACAILGFALFAVLVLIKSPALLEPDDYAYRASIVALSHGQILLSNSQYHALSKDSPRVAVREFSSGITWRRASGSAKRTRATRSLQLFST